MVLACAVPFEAAAFPDQEKALLNVVSSQATSFIADEDRFLFLGFSNKIFRVDTQTFALTDSQVPLLEGDESDGVADVGGDVTGLAIRGNSLFAAQSDGDLLTIDLNSLSDEPSAVHVIDGSFGKMVADTESDTNDNKLYILNPGGNSVVVFDTGDETNISVGFVDGLGSPVSPSAIAIATLSGSDKIYVTSGRGLVFVMAEGATSLSNTITINAANKELPSAAVTPDGDFLLVVNSTDNVVHVIDTSTDTVVDEITLDQNSSLSGIAITEVARPDDTYAYVSGSSGLSVIDLNLNLGGFGTPTVIDFNDGGGSDSDDDPLPLTSTPRDILASSVDDGYVYTSNSNASVSVITDKPFVSIRETSLDGGNLSTDGIFTITFQSDEVGSFRVVAESSGAELATGTVDTSASDVTTPEIAFDSTFFAEGSNRVSVFVTDADGLVGRDAVDINVDTPPPGIEVLSTGFGDQKVFVTFTRLDATDIDHYNLYVGLSVAAVEAATEVAGTIDQPDSGSEVKAKIVGLDNNITVFLGIEAVDASGNVGSRTTTFPDGTAISATPEETFGLARAAGEGGCSLIYERP